jgi:Ca2+/H+ antiporter
MLVLTLSFLALLWLVLTVAATRRVLQADRSGVHKGIFLVAVWAVPLLGSALVLMGLGPAPIPPSSRPDQSHIPWV